eukprot:scaffold64111_cov69-Phaeocystis_antarctica.AAC.3
MTTTRANIIGSNIKRIAVVLVDPKEGCTLLLQDPNPGATKATREPRARPRPAAPAHRRRPPAFRPSAAKGTRASPVALAVCMCNVVSPNTRFERRRSFRHKRILVVAIVRCDFSF